MIQPFGKVDLSQRQSGSVRACSMLRVAVIYTLKEASAEQLAELVP